MGGHKRLLDYFLDFESLKVLLVLYRDNPDVTLRCLEKETGIARERLVKILAELVEHEIVEIRDKEKEQLYTLSEIARFGFERLEIKNMLH